VRNFGQEPSPSSLQPLPYGSPLTPEEANTLMQESSQGAQMSDVGAGVVFLALVAVPTFTLNPWIVKAFAPDWSYGRRLGVSFGIMLGASMLTGLIRAASGKGSNNA
jgi:hypothetical protein